jgi:hypothetical protein
MFYKQAALTLYELFHPMKKSLLPIIDHNEDNMMLPLEILESVLTYLSFDEILKSRLICTAFSRAAEGEQLWKYKLYEDFYNKKCDSTGSWMQTYFRGKDIVNS